MSHTRNLAETWRSLEAAEKSIKGASIKLGGFAEDGTPTDAEIGPDLRIAPWLDCFTCT